jgi:hypothetical protein
MLTMISFLKIMEAMLMKWLKLSMIVTLLGFASVPAMAELVPLSANMDGAQANAGQGSGSMGTGTATITLDTNSNTLSWVIDWSDLSGNPIAMHFHGPALPDQNAGVQVPTGVVGPPVIGGAVLTDTQEDDILAGLWYINLHTDVFPAGEIRGTVVDEAVAAESLAWGSVKALFK